MHATFLLVSPYDHGRTKGHLTAVLDLGQKLLARGHRVLVHAEASARPEVEAAGAEWVPHQSYQELGSLLAAARAATPRWARSSQALNLLYLNWSFRRALLSNARDLCEELEPLLRREGVDCMIYDHFAYGACYAAERAGIPALSCGSAGAALDAHGLPLQLRTSGPGRLACRMPGVMHRLVDVLLPLGRVRTEFGLPARQARHAEFFQASASPQLNIVTIHPGFVQGLPLRGNQLFVGSASFSGKAREEAEPLPPPAPGTILVSTSTVGRDRGLLRRVLEALAPLGIPVLATAAGNAQVPDDLGEHIRVESLVPHEQVIPHVAAVVTHGGLGLMGRALRYGVPMLIIPLFGDHPLNARLAEEQGLAYHLPFEHATPEAIRERLRALLEDHAMHARLKQVAGDLQKQQSETTTIEAIERLALERAKKHETAA